MYLGAFHYWINGEPFSCCPHHPVDGRFRAVSRTAYWRLGFEMIAQITSGMADTTGFWLESSVKNPNILLVLFSLSFSFIYTF
jgi:hypothetical protein